MIAHMGVKVERRLHSAAHIAVVAPAHFDHLAAEHRVGTALLAEVEVQMLRLTQLVN